jgi:hypothetical protein
MASGRATAGRTNRFTEHGRKRTSQPPSDWRGTRTSPMIQNEQPHAVKRSS